LRLNRFPSPLCNSTYVAAVKKIPSSDTRGVAGRKTSGATPASKSCTAEMDLACFPSFKRFLGIDCLG
jgi:hypothetical protein